MFVITHSITPALLKFIDRIVVMQAGSIVGAGTHEEMLSTCPVYESLYRAKTAAKAA